MFRWTRGGAEDRWHGLTRPGAYEWWGFEAVDADAGLALSLRIAAGDPMDPRYARLLSAASEADSRAPRHHILVRMVLYRDGQRLVARTLRPEASSFEASATSGAVRAGDVRVAIEETATQRIYRVDIESGTRLEFRGPPGRPAATGQLSEPVWDLAPLEQQVTGMIEVRNRTGGVEHIPFSGRGVHDHGAGPSSPLPTIRSWAWGWAHAWEFAVAWRQVLLEDGRLDTLLVMDRHGETFLGESVASRPFRSRYSLLGIPYRRQWRLDTKDIGLAVESRRTLASSPVGMRFLANVRLSVHDPAGRIRLVDGLGLSSVARPVRVRVAPVRWLTSVRDLWTSRRP